MKRLRKTTETQVKIYGPKYTGFMRKAELVSLVYFAALTLLALLRTLPPPSRLKAVGLGAAGLMLVLSGWMTPQFLPAAVSATIRDWLPGIFILLAYWQSGCFFHNPNPSLQRKFEKWDRKLLSALRFKIWANSPVAAFLELAYMLCYPVVPLGVAALYAEGLQHQVDDYWLIVLLSAYPCYALLPFVQLLPPRSIESPDAFLQYRGALRRFNLWIVRHATHQATTFPSGHVAASAAIAFALLRFAAPMGLVFLFIAIGIALGCVVGRYHYAIDVVAALLLAGAMFFIAVGVVQ